MPLKIGKRSGPCKTKNFVKFRGWKFHIQKSKVHFAQFWGNFGWPRLGRTRTRNPILALHKFTSLICVCLWLHIFMYTCIYICRVFISFVCVCFVCLLGAQVWGLVRFLVLPSQTLTALHGDWHGHMHYDAHDQTFPRGTHWQKQFMTSTLKSTNWIFSDVICVWANTHFHWCYHAITNTCLVFLGRCIRVARLQNEVGPKDLFEALISSRKMLRNSPPK